MKLKKSVAVYLGYVGEHHRPKTHSIYSNRLGLLAAALGSLKCSKITGEMVLEWLTGLRNRNGGPAAADTYRTSVTAFMQWQKFAVEKKHLKKPITNKLAKPPSRQRERLPTRQEQAIIFRMASRNFADILCCLRYTGARPSELANADIEQYDVDNKIIAIKIHKTAGRTGRLRKIGVGSRVARILRRNIGDRISGPIFLTSAGKRWSPQALSHAFRRIRNKAGLSRELVLYSMRHAAGTAICEKFGIYAAAHALGHSDIKTTQRYVHPRDELLAKYQEAL